MIKRFFIITVSVTLLMGCNEKSRDFYITSFGAKAGSQSPCTIAIQKAIDACHQSGGGRVVIPAGAYITGTIMLSSNVNLYLEQGARLLGSTDTADYWLYGRKHGIIFAYQSTGISITGEGEIDGRGTSFHHTGRAHIGKGTDFIRNMTRQGE